MAKMYGVTSDVSRGYPEAFYDALREQAARTLRWRAAQEGYAVVGPIRQEFRETFVVDEETGECYDIYRLYSWAEVESIVAAAEEVLRHD